MTEENTTETAEVEQAEPETDKAQTEPKPETDWKAEARKWEARAKENKGAAEKLAQIEEANKTEFEKAKERAEKAESESKKLKAEIERRQIIEQVASDTGVSTSVLSRMIGDTEEEISANAAAVKAAVPNYPSVKAGNLTPPKVSKEEIMQIKDSRERRAAIAQHLDLFE